MDAVIRNHIQNLFTAKRLLPLAGIVLLLLLAEGGGKAGPTPPFPLLLLYIGVAAAGFSGGKTSGIAAGIIASLYLAYQGFISPTPPAELENPAAAVFAILLYGATGYWAGTRGDRGSLFTSEVSSQGSDPFQGVADHLPLSFNLKDLEGRFLSVNTHFADRYGLSKEEVIGKTIGELTPDLTDNVARAGAHERDVARTGQVVTRDEVKYLPDGSEYHLHLVKFPVFSATGDVYAVGTVGIDVTEETLAKRALQDSETTLKSIIDNAPIMLGLKDLEGRFVACNQRFADWHHRTVEEVIGSTSRDLLSRDRAAEIAALDQKIIETGEVLVDETESKLQVQADGYPSHFRMWKFPVRDSSGKTTSLGSALLDITAQKRAEEGLKAHLDKLEDLIAERTLELTIEINERRNVERNLRQSESNLRQILERSPVGVAVVARDPYRRIFANQSFLDMFGAETEEQINATPIEDTYADPADLDRLRRLTDETGSVDAVEVRRKRLDGSEWWLLMDSRLVEFEGEAAALVWHYDITAWKEAQEALARQAELLEETVAERTRDLAQSKDLLGSIINNLPVGLIVKNRDHKVELVNQTSLDWYGLKEWDIVGEETGILRRRFQTPEETEEMNAQEEVTFTTGENQVRQVRRRLSDGADHVLNIIKFPIKDEKGEIYQVGSVSVDLTEQIRAEEAAMRAMREAERANQAKSEFLATMSHEFRTPLNAILGFSEMLRAQYFGPLGSENYREYARDIYDSGEHMLGLINDVLDIAAIEAGKRSLQVVPVDLGELVTDCEKKFEQAAKEKSIQLITEFPENLAPVKADRRALIQIMFNLLSNAVKFTERDGMVTISAFSAPGQRVIQVADTGIGIAAARLPTITEPFSQDDADPYTAQEGSGLGLSIVQSLVDLHKGTLEVQSREGVGTTVTVTLPE